MSADQWYSLLRLVLILGFVLLVLVILTRSARQRREAERRVDPLNEQIPQRDKYEGDWTP